MTPPEDANPSTTDTQDEPLENHTQMTTDLDMGLLPDPITPTALSALLADSFGQFHGVDISTDMARVRDTVDMPAEIDRPSHFPDIDDLLTEFSDDIISAYRSSDRFRDPVDVVLTLSKERYSPEIDRETVQKTSCGSDSAADDDDSITCRFLTATAVADGRSIILGSKRVPPSTNIPTMVEDLLQQVTDQVSIDVLLAGSHLSTRYAVRTLLQDQDCTYLMETNSIDVSTREAASCGDGDYVVLTQQSATDRPDEQDPAESTRLYAPSLTDHTVAPILCSNHDAVDSDWLAEHYGRAIAGTDQCTYLEPLLLDHVSIESAQSLDAALTRAAFQANAWEFIDYVMRHKGCNAPAEGDRVLQFSDFTEWLMHVN